MKVMKSLLIILLFVVSINLSCVQPRKFEANLPVEISKTNQNSSQVTSTPSNALILTVSEKREVFLQKKNETQLLGTISETETLKKSFSDLLREKEDKTAFLKISRSLKYGDVEAVIDLLKSAGAKPIGLQIQELEK